MSIEEADSEFETSDLDENGFISWEEYIGDTYGSSEEMNDVLNLNYFIMFFRIQFLGFEKCIKLFLHLFLLSILLVIYLSVVKENCNKNNKTIINVITFF